MCFALEAIFLLRILIPHSKLSVQYGLLGSLLYISSIIFHFYGCPLRLFIGTGKNGKKYFIEWLFVGGLEIQKMSVNIFYMVSVLPQTISSPYKSRQERLFLFLIKNVFIFFYFVKLFLLGYELLLATFLTTLNRAK